jgi:hypothetical protein
MPEIDPLLITRQALWLAFALGVAFGAVARQTHFCTMGAVADIVAMGDWARMRMWVLAMAVAILGFNGMVALGWVEAAKSIYAAPRLLWLSMLVGGLMFGFGMVIASGCGSRNLVRLGGGNLKSLVVLLVLAVTGFATLKGLTATWRVATVDRVALQLPAGQDLPSLLALATGLPVRQAAGLLGGAIGLALLGWVVARPQGRRGDVWLGGLGIGAVIVALWWVSGRFGHLAEDPRTLEEAFLATNSRRMEALSAVAPLAYALEWLLYFSDASTVLTMGIVAMAGIVVGSLGVALWQRDFRLEGFSQAGDLAHHLVGAALMGVGGVVALGCTIGQGLSGVSTLSLGSLLALAAIVGGARLGLAYQECRLG